MQTADLIVQFVHNACDTTFPTSTVVLEFREKVRIEMVCSEPFVEPTIKAILSSARTGEVGDGKIFVHPVERVIRIRTGEVDNAALTALNADEVQRRALGDVAALTSLLSPAPRVPYTPARRGVAARRIEPYDTRGGGPGLWPEPRLACRDTLPLCTRTTWEGQSMILPSNELIAHDLVGGILAGLVVA